MRKSKTGVPERRGLAKRIGDFSARHNAWSVFSDFVEMAAISLSNPLDIAQAPEREKQYMQTIKKYRPEEIAEFPKMLGELVEELEESKFTDVLGQVFGELELSNKWAGQYFSPYPICQIMAKMTVGDKPIPARGFLTAMEPAVGSGAMVIALAEELKAQGINYQKELHVTAVDIDIKCVHMAYVQFTLLHIPAVIVHGNSLSLEEWSRWYTPAHILGRWDWKLKQAYDESKPSEPEEKPAAPVISSCHHESQLTLF